jgi:NAD(P)-dependent dehydrogenase (short-subunit alcohol dehydrogenase family)
MTKYNLAGRTVLITGSASGIGAATARAVVKKGANVVLVDLRQEAVDTLAAELGPNAFPVAGDVTNLAAMQAVVAKVLDRFASLDVCFANAGIAASRPATIKSTSVEEFERIVEVDLLGVWRTVRACLPAVTEANGHILLTSSVYAFCNGVGNAPYAASKAAVESFGRALRGELAGTGATAGVLYPGWVDTPIIHASHNNDITKELLRIGYPGPLGRPVKPEFIAAAAVRGIEKRSARVIAPRRWAPLSMARGPFMMFSDALVDRHTRMQELLHQLDR